MNLYKTIVIGYALACAAVTLWHIIDQLRYFRRVTWSDLIGAVCLGAVGPAYGVAVALEFLLDLIPISEDRVIIANREADE
jgi:hypothetical protein